MLSLASGPVKAFEVIKTRWVATGCSSARWQQGLLAVVAAVVFWPQASVSPAVGLDPSWQAGLALARMQHLAWGPQVVFTYGPLAFLQTTAFYSYEQTLLASIYQIAVVAALFLGTAAALRQRLGATASLFGAFVTTGVVAYLYMGPGPEIGASLGMMYPDVAVLAAFAWASVPLLQVEPKRSTVFITCAALGAVAGFQLLIKLNSGLGILVIALATSLSLGWKAVGRHCATAAAFAVFIPISWLLAGQHLSDLPVWLKFAASVVLGYSDAMAMPLTRLGLLAVPALVLTVAWVVVLCAVWVRGGPKIPRRFLVLVVLATLLTARSAFGRLDTYHFSVLLGLSVVAGVITFSGVARRRSFVAVSVTLVLVYVGVFGPIAYSHAMEAFDAPLQGVDRLVSLAMPGRLNVRIEEAKARQRALYAVPDQFLKSIGSGTVHIDPYEISAAWAYDLAWRPAPVFQTYQANTPMLDELNGGLTQRTQFVLSQISQDSPATGIDGRLGVQESPRYSRALLCEYTVSGVENRWALLSRTSNHCGALTALRQISVRQNDKIDVPAPSGPNMAVLAAIDLQETAVDQLLQGAIAPVVYFTVVLDGKSYRLVAANAPEPFLVRSPASVNGTNLQIQAHTIGVNRTPSTGQQDATAQVHFYEMPVGP
jgi:hypothetical protein